MSTGVMDLDRQPVHAETITNAVVQEILGLLGLKRAVWTHRLLGWVFHPPAAILAELLLKFNNNIDQRGFRAACLDFLTRFVREVRLRGEENIPKDGPLLVAANHPAAYDVLILSANLGRDDLKVITTEIGLIKLLPAIFAHTIPVSRDVHRRLITMRTAIRHLQEGGALLIFPRGDVEPDPLISNAPLAQLDHWSASLEVFLRKAPETKTVVAIASGVLSPRWMRFPLLRLWRKPQQRQKIAELFQIIQQLVGSKDIYFKPSVVFSRPLSVADLGGSDAPQGALREAITKQAQALLVDRQR